MLHVVTWHWGNKYPVEYVDKLQAGVARNLRTKHRFLCYKPMPDKHPLMYEKGCLCRLAMFGREWQREVGIEPNDTIVSMDLDMIVTGDLDQLLLEDTDDDLTILQGVNTTNPCPFNGSVFKFRAGANRGVWEEFSLLNYALLCVPYHSFPDDQGWLYYKFPNAKAWGPWCGIYAYQKVGWPSGEDLPANAKLVAFPGWRDPSRIAHLPWVKDHWRV